MNDAELDVLAFEFFKVFSRLEYALKAAGFHSRKQNDAVEANWNKFAKSIESQLGKIPAGAIKDAIDFLLTSPPKQQVIDANGLLDWRSVSASQGTPAKDLFVYVRRVRNNLFHGGKFNGHWFAPERSEKLIKDCLTVMRWSIENSPQVREAYES